MGLGHPLAWGETAEASHPSQHASLGITLPIFLPREAGGLADQLLFLFCLGTPENLRGVMVVWF